MSPIGFMLLIGSCVFAGDNLRSVEPRPAGADEEALLRYSIGPGDKLKVTTWKEPELSGSVVVRRDGRITLPLVGDVAAMGRTPSDLAAELTRLLQTYVEFPQVTVAVEEQASSRFFVIGQVAQSGAHPLVGRTTVLQALAQAGGFTTFAKRDRVLVIRKQEGVRKAIRFDYTKIEDGKDLASDVLLLPGDTVVVP